MPRAPLPIELDFRTRRRSAGRLGWLLLAFGVTVAVIEFAGYRDAARDLAEREAIVAQLRGELRQPRTDVREARQTVGAEEAKAVLAVAARLDADWAHVFAAVAAAQGVDATWIDLGGDASRGAFRLVGEARSLPDVFDFVARLGGADGIGAAQLASYEWTRSGTTDIVRFTVNATWSGGR